MMTARRGGGNLADKITDIGLKAHVKAVQAGTATKRKLGVGDGLLLTVIPSGTGVWRWKYRLGGKEKSVSLGPYPEVGLAEARAETLLLRAQLRQGKDPSQLRQERRLTAVSATDSTFAAVAAGWLEKSRGDWSAIHYEKSLRAFERDVLPKLGRLSVAEITAPMLVAVLRPIVSRGARETAGRILQHIGGVFRYGEALGLCERDPSIAAREALPRPTMSGRRAALLEFPALRDVLRRADLAPISPPVRLAQRLCAFTVVRIGNAVEARWGDFDMDAEIPVWVLPRAQMKAKERHFDHKVLLGPTITADLKLWRKSTGGEGYVFPSPTGNDHITREALERAYSRTLGLAKVHTIHGWRAAFATLARDAGHPRDAVELTLDHIHDSAVVRSYDRGERLKERCDLMQWWDKELNG